MLLELPPIPATQDGMAGCHAQHRQTAFAKRPLRTGIRLSGRHDVVFFVNTAPQHLERFGGEVANLIGL